MLKLRLECQKCKSNFDQSKVLKSKLTTLLHEFHQYINPPFKTPIKKPKGFVDMHKLLDFFF